MAIPGKPRSVQRHIGVYFVRCTTYGRVYERRPGWFEGRCPRCGRFLRVQVLPGAGVPSQIVFEC